jgi:hypothetical protein
MVRMMNFAPQEGDNPPVNRPAGGFDCISSGCMMWRSVESAFDRKRAEDEYRRTGNRNVEIKRSGYCGLAGKPVEP